MLVTIWMANGMENISGIATDENHMVGVLPSRNVGMKSLLGTRGFEPLYQMGFYHQKLQLSDHD
jgi:hypothetical protein